MPNPNKFAPSSLPDPYSKCESSQAVLLRVEGKKGIEMRVTEELRVKLTK